METDKIVLVKTFSGDMILGKKVEDANAMMQFIVTLKDPRVVVIAPTMTGTVRIALGTVCEPFKVQRLKEKVEIPKSQIFFELDESEIDNELVNGYKSEVAGIKLASAADIAKMQ